MMSGYAWVGSSVLDGGASLSEPHTGCRGKFRIDGLPSGESRGGTTDEVVIRIRPERWFSRDFAKPG
jgi:hypothetical protein